MASPVKDIAESIAFVSKQGARGPFLILAGSMLLYFLVPRIAPSQDSLTSVLVAVAFVGLPGLVLLAGIALTFKELAGDAHMAEEAVLPQTSSDLEHVVGQLTKNFEILRRQTTQGFTLSATFMLMGLLAILTGSVGEYFGLVQSGTNLTSSAGIIMEFISGTALVIYRINFNRLNATSDRLQSTWGVLSAFRMAAKLPEDEKTAMTVSLINRMVNATAAPSQALSKA